MEKAELLKMRKDLELPKTTVKGLAENKSIFRRLDEASQGTAGGADETIQRTSAGKIEIAAGTGTGLKCQEVLERLSWSKTIQGMAHGGIAEEIHVVFVPMS